MITKHKELIYEYWNKTELGRKMIKSNNVSDLDLLFLIPNNAKKRLGLPFTRISGKKKRKQKHQRKRFIMSFQCLDIIGNIIEEHLTSAWSNSEFFGEFVEIKNCNLGDKNYQELSDFKGVKIMYQNCCKKCGSVSLYTEQKGNNIGLYCSDCGAWIKWLGKDEARAFEHIQKTTKNDIIECDIPLGRLCCFKPLDSNEIYFGHMAGKVVDDFEQMSFMYVLTIDDRYFFSRKVIIKPDDVHTSNEAKRYFDFE